MALIDQLGAEGFTDTGDVATRTAFTASAPFSNVVDLTVLNIADEKWIDVARFGSFNRTFVFPNAVTDTPAHEFEVHLAIYAENAAFDNSIFSIVVNNQVSISLLSTANPSNPLESVLLARYTPQDSGQRVDETTEMVVNAGSLFYVVFRLKGQSIVGGVLQQDGEAEAWINNQRVLSETGLSHGTSTQNQHFGNAQARYSSANSSGNSLFIRNISIFDEWTTPAGTAPQLRHVIDGSPDAVTIESGTAWTNEGGAASFEDAVSDIDDTTYLETLQADAHVVAEIQRPADLSTQPGIDVVVRGRVGRATAAPNTIDVATVTDAAGGTDIDSKEQNVSAIGPARENLNIILDNAGNTTLFVKINNGS